MALSKEREEELLHEVAVLIRGYNSAMSAASALFGTLQTRLDAAQRSGVSKAKLKATYDEVDPNHQMGPVIV